MLHFNKNNTKSGENFQQLLLKNGQNRTLLGESSRGRFIFVAGGGTSNWTFHDIVPLHHG
jgi:hypothetical protein